MRQSTWWTFGGIVAVIGGLFALFNPFPASVVASLIAGWAFLLGGIFQIIALFDAKGVGNKILLGLFGALSIFIGITLFRNPLEGVLTLTLAVAIMLVVSGVIRFVMSFSLRGTPAFWPVMLSSIISLLLGFMIFNNYPSSAASILGIMLGVELLFNGFALLSLAHYARKGEKALAGN